MRLDTVQEIERAIDALTPQQMEELYVAAREMTHRANADFWNDYRALPVDIRARLTSISPC